MLQFCPRCGGRLEPEHAGAGGLVTCPACGAGVSDFGGGAAVIDPQSARQKARPPAIGLMIVGGLVILSGAAGSAAMGVPLAIDGLPAGGEERQLMLFMFAAMAAAGLGSLATGSAIAFGGYRMYHLQSWRFALVASILAVVSFAGCCMAGLFGVLGLPGLPVGIWAIVVLNDPNVRAAFR